MSSIKPKQDGNELNGAEESVCQFVIAGGDCPETLEFAEEALDEIAFAIESEVGFALDASAGVVGNDRGDSALIQLFDQGIGVVSLVGEKGFRLDLFEQGCCLCQVVSLAWGKR